MQQKKEQFSPTLRYVDSGFPTGETRKPTHARSLIRPFQTDKKASAKVNTPTPTLGERGFQSSLLPLLQWLHNDSLKE